MLRRVVLTRATGRNFPEETILHSHRRGNLKSYIATLLFSNFCFLAEKYITLDFVSIRGLLKFAFSST
jgi:hypothetical protein